MLAVLLLHHGILVLVSTTLSRITNAFKYDNIAIRHLAGAELLCGCSYGVW